MSTKHVIERIKIARKINKLTQKQMAEKLGVSDTTYKKIELGQQNIEISRLTKIADILNLDLTELFAEVPSKVITFVNQKGGTGKSTLSVITATNLKERHPEKRIAILDLDFQSSSEFVHKISENPLVEVFRVDIHESTSPVVDFLNTLKKVKKECEYVIIDTAGSVVLAQFISAVLSETNLAVVPLELTDLTVHGTLPTITLIEDAASRRKEQSKTFKALAVANKMKANVSELKYRKDLKLGDHIEMMDAYLTSKVTYGRDLSLDRALTNKEVEAFINEIESWV
ncbi:AAA family ATPase [Flammeovirga agarivorans]|uniref:AAA family ATPase n=1 Tax=Flammeovirga agarivorans TaxID=2726742 RepID=A0A7X8XZ96_9BACT|nr:helix-turn-helix domain-containing protein [Flammeovirga agarivorans]NLR94848.1 AAA family ATPase [Flammeovirga agarivorans]